MISNSKTPEKAPVFFGIEQLQERVTTLFALLASILVIFLALSDYFLGLNAFVILLKMAMAIPFLMGYFLLRKRGYYQPVINVLLVVSHIGIFLNYINNDGFRGPTIYTYFILIVAFVVLLRGWVKIAWFVCSLLAYSTIFYLDISGKIQVVQNYDGVENLYWDHLITILWCSIFIFVALYIFISRYTDQTRQLEKLSQEQKVNLERIQLINDEKNRLLALLSHDLKNPIGTLSTTLSLIDEGVFETREIESILNSLKEQSYHLNKVLNNTLSYVLSEIHSEVQHVEVRSVVDFSTELRDVMQVQASQKKQEIDLTVHGKDMEIQLEVNEISIILKNLLDNAIKFSEVNSQVFFTLEIKEGLIRWLVTNEGKEIAQSEHAEIFRFKARTSYGTVKEKGTGLGLPLSKKIAEANGLVLGFESSAFKTVFFLEKEI